MTCKECGKEFPRIDSMSLCWECWWGDGVFVENKPADETDREWAEAPTTETGGEESC